MNLMKFILIFLLSLTCLSAQQLTTARTGRAAFTYGTAAFGAVTTSYATLLANTTGIKWVALRCATTLDRDILFSTDGTTDQFAMKSLDQTFYMDFGILGMDVRTPLRIKAVGSGPTVGNIYCTGFYR